MGKWKGVKVSTGFTTGRTYETREEAIEAIRAIVELDDEQLSLYYAIEVE